MTAGGRPPLRLAFLIGTVSGGTGRHAAALTAGCRRAGAEVSVLGPAQAHALFDPGICFLPVEIGDRPRPVSDARAILGLRRQLRDLRPDVLHAHGVRAGAFTALAMPARRGQRAAGRGSWPALVLTVHNAPPEGALSRVVYAALEHICARRCDVVLCAADDLVARMRALGGTAARIDIPASPADPPSAAAVATASADIGADGRPVVLAVGRLARQKGLDVLIAAAARWRDRAGAPLTVIAGGGPLAAQLEQQARRAGADVLLLGERDDVPALLAIADVFVLPSRWEARALVLQEAMRAGRAIVATSSGGTPGLTGAGAAVLIPPDDAAALAEAVMAVLSDPAMAATLGLAARARAAEFPTQGDAVRRAMEIYQAVAETRSPEQPPPGPLV